MMSDKKMGFTDSGGLLQPLQSQIASQERLIYKSTNTGFDPFEDNSDVLIINKTGLPFTVLSSSRIHPTPASGSEAHTFQCMVFYGITDKMGNPVSRTQLASNIIDSSGLHFIGTQGIAMNRPDPVFVREYPGIDYSPPAPEKKTEDGMLKWMKSILKWK